MTGRWIKLVLFTAGALVLAAALALVYMKYAPRRTPVGQPPLATLGKGDLGPFEEAFNAATDRIRVVAMLSPT